MKDGNGKFNPALLDYVRQGSIEVLQSLLRNDYPDSIDLDGKTLLHHAAESNNVSMTRHFINNNHNLDIVENRGKSPLMLAMENRSYNSAKLLVEAGADIYLRSDEAANILSYAEAKLNSRYLPSNEYHVFVKYMFQKLTKDCLNDEKTMLSRLREFGYSLVQAISLGDASVTRLMLENGYLVDERDLRTNETALHRAVYLGDFENVKVLLEFGASVHAPDRDEYPPLCHLFEKPSDSGEDEQERMKIMKILIDHGALSGKAPGGPLQYIFECGGLRAITALAQYDIDFNHAAALSSLVNHKNNDVLEIIRGKNINVDVLENGYSLLSMAVCWGSLRKVQFLLECGADPNIVNDDGQTPLSSVFYYYFGTDSRENLLAIVRLLLQYGADAQQVITNEYQERQTVFDMENDSSLQQQALESVIAHLAMIESCGETISNIIRQKIDSRDTFEEHFQVCKKQFEEMKKTMVNGSVTLYKLLTESHLKITRYARDPEFALKFEEAMKVKWYLDPYFSISLHERVGKAIREAKLKEEAVIVMNKILPCHLRNCTEIFGEILAYLTCDDLKNICKVYDLKNPNLPT